MTVSKEGAWLGPSAAALALVLMAGAAQAHTRLASAVPAANAAVAAGPKDLQLSFSGSILAKLSAVTVTGPGGQAVHTGAVEPDPKDKKRLKVPLHGQLSPGAYKVNWTVVSADSHKMQGGYSFTVKP